MEKGQSGQSGFGWQIPSQNHPEYFFKRPKTEKMAGVAKVGAAFSSIQDLRNMFWRKPDKEKERYYLLAGMGGRSLRRKNKIILLWAIVAGLLISSVVGVAMYFFNTTR